MVAYKYVSLRCEDMVLENLKSVTEAKVSEEIDSDITPTFDDPVPVPSGDNGYSIDLSFLETRDVDEFILLKRILKAMKSREGTLQIKETYPRKNGDVTETNDFSGVILSSNEVSYDATDLTARDISFTAKSCIERVNGVEI